MNDLLFENKHFDAQFFFLCNLLRVLTFVNWTTCSYQNQHTKYIPIKKRKKNRDVHVIVELKVNQIGTTFILM